MRQIKEKPGLSHRFTKNEIELERFKPLSVRMLHDLTFIAELLPGCTDWLVIKKRLMLELPIDQRQLFSTRDPVSKRHYPFSDFEKKIRDEWFRLTGNMLLMPEERKMVGVDPKSYL